MIEKICECPNCGKDIKIEYLLEKTKRVRILNLTEKRIWILKEVKENDGITTSNLIKKHKGKMPFKISRITWYDNLNSLKLHGYIKIIKAKSRSHKPKPYENYLYITEKGLKYV